MILTSVHWLIQKSLFILSYVAWNSAFVKVGFFNYHEIKSDAFTFHILKFKRKTSMFFNYNDLNSNKYTTFLMQGILEIQVVLSEFKSCISLNM